jgi:hypothetical protein
MHLCAPIENMKNTINTKIVQLSLSATPWLPLRLGGYWRGPGLWPPLTARLSPLNTRQSNTTDNVKAKIDNVKEKIQDKEE